MPIDPEYVKARIDRAREEIGRYVTFYTPANNQDFVASGFYNPLTYTGYITEYTTTEVLARVHWAGDERITATPGGKHYVGSCSLGVDPEYHELAQICMNANDGKVEVDGKFVKITEINPVGAPTVNRLKLVCKSIGTKPEA